MVLTTIVLWIHIFGAIGWLGAAMVFGMVIGPSLPKLSPQARAELLIKIIPRFARYIVVFAVLTLAFGVITATVILNGDFSVSLSTPFGLYISIGAALALVVAVIALGVVLPTISKIVKMTESLAKSPGPPPPELIAASNRLRMGSLVALVFLILVTMFMVAGATL